jgi:cytosine/adenosine deaminase-related metal-dependent hydrolase
MTENTTPTSVHGIANGKDSTYADIAQGQIVTFGRGSKPESTAPLDAEGLSIKPGRINAHTHIYSGLAPLGMPEPDVAPENFLQILERVWWRLDRALDEASLRASAQLYVAKSLLYGTTTLVDHHESPQLIEGSLDIIADVCQELGMRALLCYGITERNFGRDEARRGLKECRRFIEQNKRPLVQGMVGIHASFTVSDESIRETGELCRELNIPLHIHLAEDGADVKDAQERGYAGPLQRLLALNALPPRSLLAHGVHLQRDEVLLAEENDAFFMQNPRSNEGNAVGYAGVLAAGKAVAIGTDGYPADMLAEVEALRRLAGDNNDDMPKVENRIEGAYSLLNRHFDAPFSPLARGSMADIIIEDENDGSPPRHVMVNGQRVVSDGQLVNGNLKEIEEFATSQAAALWSRMKDL